MIARFVFAVIAVVFSPFPTHAQNPSVPLLLNYQGQLRSADGTPQSGTFSMTFRFFDAEAGGNQLPPSNPWTEAQSVVVSDGIFNVLLGSVSGLPDELFDGGPTDSKGPLRFLEVTVEGETLSPRKRVASAAYAISSNGRAGATSEECSGVPGISAASASAMKIGEAFGYCESLVESGRSDWRVPTSDELVFAMSGGTEIPGGRGDRLTWTQTFEPIDGVGGSSYRAINLASAEWGYYNTNATLGVRCVPISSSFTMDACRSISAVSSMSGMVMRYGPAFEYCADLEEGGFSDWRLPAMADLMFLVSGGGEFAGGKTNQAVWSATFEPGSNGSEYLGINLLTGEWQGYNNNATLGVRCVR